jgi:hypothetical protein
VIPTALSIHNIPVVSTLAQARRARDESATLAEIRISFPVVQQIFADPGLADPRRPISAWVTNHLVPYLSGAWGRVARKLL